MAAPADDPNPEEWGCENTVVSTDIAFGTGKTNSVNIVNNCGSNNAAGYCRNLTSQSGYNSWYLPSQMELDMLFQQQANVPGLSGTYWSSSGYGTGYAWIEDFTYGPGHQMAVPVGGVFNVRAIGAW